MPDHRHTDPMADPACRILRLVPRRLGPCAFCGHMGDHQFWDKDFHGLLCDADIEAIIAAQRVLDAICLPPLEDA